MADAVTGWSDDRVEQLGKLWAEGLSASQIAGILGGGVTRNAVIGKVHRLGLSGRGKNGPSSTRPAKPSPAAEGQEAGERAQQATEPRPDPDRTAVEPRRPLEAVEVPAAKRVSILDLRDTMCRWPIGDPTSADFGFCGARAVTGLPYCDAHCRIAYQPAAERKRIRA